MNFAHLFLGLHNSYIHLSIFFMTFSVIIQWQHDIWCHKWWYELLAPWPMCPPSFIEISWKMSEISPLFNTKTFTTTTTSIIIIIAKMKPHNKIPFPFWGNGIITTRGTVQGAQWIPFPSFRYGKKTGYNENLRRKWIICKSSHVSNYK